MGTAAAEGIPAVFCNCALCKKIKNIGGKNIRTRSQILVNENLLLDFPPDTYLHTIRDKLDLSNVKDLFITHAHPDHCSPTEFRLRGAPYAHGMAQPVLNVYASETVLNGIENIIGGEFKEAARQTVRMRAVAPYERIILDGINVTALPAAHTKGEHCFIFLLEQTGGAKKPAFLQFNDSGILPDEVYEYLKTRGAMLDAIAFDCTYGYFQKGSGRHMGFLDAAGEKRRMEKFGILNNDCKLILTHFSHNNGLTHDELQDKVKDSGFTVAYDGMEIEI